MKTEGERISDIISHFCESKADFARKMEESPQTISNWVSRGAGKNVLNKILSKFPDVNANWLLTGEGDMLKPSQSYSINNEVKGSFVGSSFVGGSNNGSIKTNVVSEPSAEYSSGKRSVELEKENMKLKSENLILKAQLEERDRFIKMLLEKK